MNVPNWLKRTKLGLVHFFCQIKNSTGSQNPFPDFGRTFENFLRPSFTEFRILLLKINFSKHEKNWTYNVDLALDVY